ncbi:Coenzyme A biosynthesis bifunctional protein CoaBC [bioreactor metagenome]|uniref:Coenzyme A biosynthesis bifunctional protein CoaBC n=1 Tax=bioreactor metagenome TaxID=1076179 RepID=A0A644T2Q2_9ZZZZ|nr:bifunctional phosphopantothenoylcysteine decarboxylase/phosphopantothenate--cysteine ligase CoaBC [Negativicutes bacterium]
MLNGRKIVVGVTGGIASYKSIEIVSRLKKAGASVRVIMTESATKFVTPLPFREISGGPVVTSMWGEPTNWNIEHIALANWADLFLIAPATANIIGKIANGIADDMLSTTIMATKAPVVLAPAMNSNMYANPIVKQNIQKLTNLGYSFIQPSYGMLACGVEGQGRLPDPVFIIDTLASLYGKTNVLCGKKVVITAGGTREPIDPVRYIGNRSSGKMGYAIADQAAKMGAQVVLISGPSNLSIPNGVELIKVETALQMKDIVLSQFSDADIVIKAAAVADYRVQNAANHKIKKSEDTLTLILEKNPDILLELGKRKTHQFLVGFAAETQNLLSNATEKLTRKNLDMIVANDVSLPGAGFNTDTNIVKLLYRTGQTEELPQMSKTSLAKIILDKISAQIQK